MCVIVYGGMFKELEAIKARVKEMEEEAEKLKEMQKQVEETIMSPPASQPACKMKQMFLFSLEKVLFGTTNSSQPLMHTRESRSGWV